MPSYTIIAFDFDGTLVDSRAAIVTSVQAAFKDFELTPPTWDAVLETMGRPVEKTFPGLHGGTLPAEKNLALVARFRELYLVNAKTQLSVYPGILDLLEHLKRRGKNIGVVTSKISSATWENSRQLGIADYFGHVVGAHDVKNPKPDAEPLRVLCEKFGKPVDAEVIVVGDATFDIEMAHNAGVHSCAVTWGAGTEVALHKTKPTYIARTAAELAEIVCG